MKKIYVIQISKAEIEQILSSYSYIKNKFRNRLLDENMKNLFYIIKKEIS